MVGYVAYNDSINVSISPSNGHYHANNDHNMYAGMKLLHY